MGRGRVTFVLGGEMMPLGGRFRDGALDGLKFCYESLVHHGA